MAFDPIDAPTWFAGSPLPVVDALDPTRITSTGVVRAAPGAGGVTPAAISVLDADPGEPRHRVAPAIVAPAVPETPVSRRVLVGLGALGLVGCGFAASSLLRPDTPAAPVLPPLATEASPAALALAPGGVLPGPVLPAAPAATGPAKATGAALTPSRSTARSTAARPARATLPRTPPRAVPAAGAPVAAPIAAPPGAAPPGYAAAYPPRPVYRPRTYTPAPQQAQRPPQSTGSGRSGLGRALFG